MDEGGALTPMTPTLPLPSFKDVNKQQEDELSSITSLKSLNNYFVCSLFSNKKGWNLIPNIIETKTRKKFMVLGWSSNLTKPLKSKLSPWWSPKKTEAVIIYVFIEICTHTKIEQWYSDYIDNRL